MDTADPGVEANVALDVVDTHHHVGDARDLLSGLVATGTPAPEDFERLEFDTRLATMDRHGVGQAILIPGHAYLRPDGLADTRSVNDAIAAYRDRRPDRFPAAIGIVEPLFGSRGLDEVTRIQDELGLVGVSFHARFQGVANDSVHIKRLVGRMAELGLVPYVHAVAEVPDESIWRVLDLARDYPDVPMVVLDAFSSFEQARHIATVAELAPSLLFDTSLTYTADFVVNVVRRIGAERVLFGTDLYSHPLGYASTHVLDQLLAAELPEEDKRAILAGNVRRLLGLGAL